MDAETKAVVREAAQEAIRVYREDKVNRPFRLNEKDHYDQHKALEGFLKFWNDLQAKASSVVVQVVVYLLLAIVALLVVLGIVKVAP